MADHHRGSGGPRVPGATLVQADQRTIQGDGSHGNPLHAADDLGAIFVRDEGQTLPGGPYRVLDFVGLGIAARDAGGGVAQVVAPGGFLVEQNGVAVPGTPHIVLDFAGAGVAVVDLGSGRVQIAIPGGVVVAHEGVATTKAPCLALNFTGAGVAVTAAGDRAVDVHVPGGGSTGSTVLLWGLGIFTTVPAFVQPGGTSADPSSDDRHGVPLPFGGVLRHLIARHNTAGGSDGAVATYTVWVDGVPTALAVSVPTGIVGQASNLVAQVVVPAGAVVSLSVASESFGPNVINAKISLELAPAPVPTPTLPQATAMEIPVSLSSDAVTRG